MILKMIDLSLMSEHLPVHKAELDKLASFICSLEDPTVKQIAYEQYVIMKNHVKVMIGLMNPNQNEQITTADLQNWEPVEINCQVSSVGMSQENMWTELKTSAQTMANNNFESSLRMKAKNVRNIHLHMAMQQSMILDRYTEYMESMTEDTAPEASKAQQIEAMETFKKMFNL
ncbi:hypothetical protein [Halobacillus mangrovi]|uniref:hypothetical protein n=1 Tax=Halobacillus mangrovi TaxID=402384 RepID=UPI003D981357